MPAVIVLETGLGSDPTANAYITVADVSAYATEMGNTSWDAASASPDDARTTAVIRACRSLDRLYGKRFIGSPMNFGTQAMEWPRYNARVNLDLNPSSEYGITGYVVPDNIVPPEVKKACCEAALLELETPGGLTPSLDRGGDIKSVQAGSVGVVFADGAPRLTKHTSIDGILRPLLKTLGSDLVLG